MIEIRPGWFTNRVRVRRVPFTTLGWEVRGDVPVAGDSQSLVSDDTIATLVDLAKQDRRADFFDLAAMVGVAAEQREALWAGTRKRLGMEAGR